MTDYSALQQKADTIRKWSLESTSIAGSGHPTSSMSAADICTVLFEKYFTYDVNNPLNPNNDRLVFSKGHASPLFFSLWAMAGGIDPSELNSLRKFGSRLEGHPTMHFPFTDAATGSLGQGLSVGAGMAYISKKEKRKNRVFVLLGDGELAEGQVWEAGNFASYYQLHNLIAIADINRLAQSQETMFGHNIQEYTDRFRAFGFEVMQIDGHDMAQIDSAFKDATQSKEGKPIAIVAKTMKGKGVTFLENKDGWHGKALKKEDLEKALLELKNTDDSLRFTLKAPAKETRKATKKPISITTSYTPGEEIATRDIYGSVLAQIGEKNDAMYALDGDVKNSTFSQDFLKAYPERFIECFIAEQNMVSVAVGLSRLGKIPFVSTFAAFFTRAADQIRMAALSNANISFCGSHAGVSIGEDGASQMGLEDMAMFGTLPGSVVLHPSDAVSTAKLLPLIAEHVGISYLRTLRPKTPVMYKNSDSFTIGGSKILRKSSHDLLTVVACGVTVQEALQAYDMLLKKDITIRVIDCYSVKPIDAKTLREALSQTKYQVIISAEDHFAHGGLGDFVRDGIGDSVGYVEKMAVDHISRSGVKDELLADAGIDADHIVKRVLALKKRWDTGQKKAGK